MASPNRINLNASLEIAGRWTWQARTASRELNVLMAHLELNATLIGRAIALIRLLRQALDHAVQTGDLAPAKALSHMLDTHAPRLASLIAQPTTLG